MTTWTYTSNGSGFSLYRNGKHARHFSMVNVNTDTIIGAIVQYWNRRLYRNMGKVESNRLNSLERE